MKCVSLERRKARPSRCADRAHIYRTDLDRFAWSGVVHVTGEPVFGQGPAEFTTVNDAETDAAAWATAHGATELLARYQISATAELLAWLRHAAAADPQRTLALDIELASNSQQESRFRLAEKGKRLAPTVRGFFLE